MPIPVFIFKRLVNFVYQNNYNNLSTDIEPGYNFKLGFEEEPADVLYSNSSSTTILSSLKSSTVTANDITFSGSTFYHPYYEAATMTGVAPLPSVNDWPGDSIKILLSIH